MLELVDVGPRSLNAYRGVAPDAILDDLVRYASELRGARVLHVNATPYGGGMSELLRSGVPILNDLGLIAHCGMSVSPDEAAPQVKFDGATYRFCSDTCRHEFLRNPGHYAQRARRT